MKYFRKYKSPIGTLTLISGGDTLSGLEFEKGKYNSNLSSMKEVNLPVFKETELWLDTYFNEEKPDFTPPIHLEGSPFRLSVWNILKEIPYGEIITYGHIAEKLAKERGIKKMSAQAVGGAVGHNPIGIIIPCHRVIGKNGSLTGFSGGIEAKIYLLKTESAFRQSFYVPETLYNSSTNRLP